MPDEDFDDAAGQATEGPADYLPWLDVEGDS